MESSRFTVKIKRTDDDNKNESSSMRISVAIIRVVLVLHFGKA